MMTYVVRLKGEAPDGSSRLVAVVRATRDDLAFHVDELCDPSDCEAKEIDDLAFSIQWPRSYRDGAVMCDYLANEIGFLVDDDDSEEWEQTGGWFEVLPTLRVVP